MPSSKIHCCYLIISAELKVKHILEPLTLGLKEASLKDCCHNNSEFKKKHLM